MTAPHKWKKQQDQQLGRWKKRGHPSNPKDMIYWYNEVMPGETIKLQDLRRVAESLMRVPMPFYDDPVFFKPSHDWLQPETPSRPMHRGWFLTHLRNAFKAAVKGATFSQMLDRKMTVRPDRNMETQILYHVDERAADAFFDKFRQVLWEVMAKDGCVVAPLHPTSQHAQKAAEAMNKYYDSGGTSFENAVQLGLEAFLRAVRDGWDDKTPL